MNKRFSAPVTTKDRAGRAPYNFVPLPDKTRWLTETEQPPTLDHYEGLSGWIDVRMEALTNFYTRGMWPLGEHTGDKQTLPFTVDGRLRLPGSSWRGMVRSLVEIFGDAPLDPVNDDQLFFRAVSANLNPGERHFDPNAQNYKNLVAPEQVRAGYITCDRDKWFIRPAVNPEKYYKIHISELPDDKKWWARDKNIHFVLTHADRGRLAKPGEAEAHRGALISTGTIGRQWMDYRDRREGSKQYQWLIHEEGKTEILIPPEDVKTYLEAGISQEIDHRGFGYDFPTKAAPCFYVCEKDHVWFGHTRFFRLPYKNTVGNGIPFDNRREQDPNGWDLAQSIFGRIPGKGEEATGQRGRVYFEDALLSSDSAGPIDPIAHPVVLGTPKPSFFPHYLVQKSDKLEDSIHWDGDWRNQGEVVVRGSKQYPHRPDAPGASGGNLPPVDNKQVNVVSWIQPARKGAVFTARLRFENLREWELGALLMAIDLPAGCSHKLGMAKPLGLGSFRLTVAKLQEIDRTSRYQSFFEAAEDVEEAHMQIGAKVAQNIDYYKSKFSDWYWIDHEAERKPIWEIPRIVHLKELLKFEKLPTNWTAITRYLRFGKVNGRIYNEYTEIEPHRPRASKRRPLPPAVQVAEASPAKIPSDGDPGFELPNGQLASRRGAELG